MATGKLPDLQPVLGVARAHEESLALQSAEQEWEAYFAEARIDSNVAHEVQRYTHLFVASELVSDVEGGIQRRILMKGREYRFYQVLSEAKKGIKIRTA